MASRRRSAADFGRFGRTEMTYSINQIQEDMRDEGSHWWDPDTMRFFGTKVVSGVWEGPGGIYFITSMYFHFIPTILKYLSEESSRG